MPGMISEFADLGCLIQANSSSIINKPYRKLVLSMIDNGLVDFIASDCHDISVRTPNISDAYRIISEELGNDHAERLKASTQKIIK